MLRIGAISLCEVPSSSWVVLVGYAPRGSEDGRRRERIQSATHSLTAPRHFARLQANKHRRQHLFSPKNRVYVRTLPPASISPLPRPPPSPSVFHHAACTLHGLIFQRRPSPGAPNAFVEIEFMDRAFKPIRFADPYLFDLASMGRLSPPPPRVCLPPERTNSCESARPTPSSEVSPKKPTRGFHRRARMTLLLVWGGHVPSPSPLSPRLALLWLRCGDHPSACRAAWGVVLLAAARAPLVPPLRELGPRRRLAYRSSVQRARRRSAGRTARTALLPPSPPLSSSPLPAPFAWLGEKLRPSFPKQQLIAYFLRAVQPLLSETASRPLPPSSASSACSLTRASSARSALLAPAAFLLLGICASKSSHLPSLGRGRPITLNPCPPLDVALHKPLSERQRRLLLGVR